MNFPNWWGSKYPHKITDALIGIKKIPDNSVDFICTDPPYGINTEGIINDDSLDVYYKILPDLYRILKDNKWFVTFAPMGRLPDMFKSHQFSYSWMGVIYYSNRERLCHTPCGYSKLSLYLMFKKGDAKINKKILDIHEHIHIKYVEIGHTASKPVSPVMKLITCCSAEGNIVFDPFLGSGTTIEACLRTNRIGIGYEINPEYEPLINKKISDYNQEVKMSSLMGYS